MKRSLLFLRLAGYIFLLFTLAHSFAHFSDPSSSLQDDDSRRVWQLIQTHGFNLQGSVFTVGSFLTGYDWFLMIMTFFSGLQLLLTARSSDRQLIRQITLLHLVFVGALFAATAVYFKILPPMILFALIWTMLLISLLTARRADSTDLSNKQ